MTGRFLRTLAPAIALVVTGTGITPLRGAVAPPSQLPSEPLDKRHIKSTYASATPATDGRIVVSWFGSHGVHAYTVGGAFLWKVDLGRVDVGAWEAPAIEWGPASSPIIWDDLVMLQVDTQDDSFLVALARETAEEVWKIDRDERPAWSTPTVVATAHEAELVTNGAKYVRGYDPRTGAERWRLANDVSIPAPTPILGAGLAVVASGGLGSNRPIWAVRPGARGDLTVKERETNNGSVAWSRERRGRPDARRRGRPRVPPHRHEFHRRAADGHACVVARGAVRARGAERLCHWGASMTPPDSGASR